MSNENLHYAEYFSHLRKISLLGRLYKKWITSPLLYARARSFGPRILEVGSGIGAGILGAYGKIVVGADINPLAVQYCQELGLAAHIISPDNRWPFAGGSFDACVLDNVLEHLENPSLLLEECCRVTTAEGGLVVAVPGSRGYQADADHKMFYGESDLRSSHRVWELVELTATPFRFASRAISGKMRQYCLVATYAKATIRKGITHQ